jgi:putative glutamine amidotransferase
LKRNFVFALALAMAVAAPNLSACQKPAPERYLDSAPERDGGVRLVIFNPDISNIRCLVALRNNGAIEIPDLTVVGVYHVRQRANFEGSRAYVRENGLDWFKFHEVSAEISEPVLFKKNACTPEFEQIVKKADGVIFFGGPDIPPSVYGESTLLLTEIIDPYRHFLEASAAFHLLGGFQDEGFAPLLGGRPDFPVLGICLGLQTLNIATGGTLVQDISSEVYGKATVEEVIALGPEQWHTNPYTRLMPQEDLMYANYHTIQLDGNGLFMKAMGFKASDHPRIRSSHHQALEKLGKGLVPAARSRDGRIIEAVEHEIFPNVLGVQFHPEHYMHFDADPQFKQKPGDTPTSLRAILEGAPPSFEFNKGIWRWFSARLVDSHGARD